MDTTIKNFKERMKSITLIDAAVGFVVAFILSLIFDMILKPFGLKNAEFSMVFALFLFFVFCFRGVTDFKSNLNEVFAGENRKEILYILILNFFFGFFILSLFGSIDPSFAKDLTVVKSTGWIFVLNLITSIIFVPIVEELIFRGVIFSRLNMRMNFVYAMLISSVLFSLFHGFGRMTVTFVFGLALCLLYLKTDNILIPIVIHILGNFLGSLCTDFAHIEQAVSTAPLSYVLIILSIISGIMLIMYIVKNTKALKVAGAS